MISIPAWPEHGPLGDAPLPLRYEDIAQDGRFLLDIGGKAIGEAVWRKLISHLPERDILRKDEVIPILSRIIAVGSDGPFSVDARPQAKGTYALAKDGDRLCIDMWSDLWAPHGRTWGPPSAGEPALGLRIFAEHVLTRLFAPPERRKVTSVPGLTDPPARRFSLPTPTEMLVLPDGATALDEALRPDDRPWVFSLRHTDSNQHVNSLVYPRLFEEALARRLHARGRSAAVLATAIDCVYRKPCFAGDVVRVHLRAFEANGHFGAIGQLLPEGDEGAKPLTTFRLFAR